MNEEIEGYTENTFKKWIPEDVTGYDYRMYSEWEPEDEEEPKVPIKTFTKIIQEEEPFD
jgi:hypothetical protein